MNSKSLVQKARAMIAKTRNIIQLSKERRERSQQRSGFTDPKEAKRVHKLLFGSSDPK
jgi:hypothetical protein